MEKKYELQNQTYTNPYINILETQIEKVFSQIKTDRSVLHRNKLFETNHFKNLSSQEIYNLRKHIKVTKHNLIEITANLDLETAKDLNLKILLYEQMKYELQRIAEIKQQGNTAEKV